MYLVCSFKDTVKVPPKAFGKKHSSTFLNKTILKILQEEYEGIVDENVGVVIAILNVKKVGEGKVILGEGSPYYETEYEALIYKPEIQEVVEGIISEITEFGAFVRIGPIEGLIHVSQIMNDYINYDAKTPAFIGKESNKKLQLNDSVLSRIVTVSFKGNIPNSKIGLTMRQEGLGKANWKEIDKKLKEKKEKKAKKEIKGEKKK